MKKIHIFLGLLVLFVLGFFLYTKSAPSSQEASATNQTGTSATGLQAIKDRGVLRVGVKQDVPKFGFLNPDTGEFEGMEIQIARKIADDLGVDVAFTPVTAQTRGPLIDNGQVDMVIATFTITDERKLLYHFSTPYYTDAVGFLVNKNSGIKSIEDLDGKHIGVAQGSTTRSLVSELADQEGISVTFAELGSYPELSVSLRAHRIDAFSVDQSILSGYISSQSELMDFSFSASDYGIASSLDNTELNDYLDNLINTWKSDGTLQSIYDENGLKPVTKTDQE